MTEVPSAAGIRLRLARQTRGLSQQQLAGMAAVTRQAVSAVESGHSDPSLRVALALASALGINHNTCPFNVTGHPAFTVPCAKSEGLPIGMMLVGRKWQEASLLRAAYAFEETGAYTVRLAG